MEKPSPMCPFCNRENAYVARNSYDNWHCYNCGGDFSYNGEPLIWPEEDEEKPFQLSPEQIREIYRSTKK